MKFYSARLARTWAVALTLALVGATAASAVLPRSTKDRKDGSRSPQIHLIYAVPLDGEDRGLDTDGTIVRSVQASRRWFQEASNGRDLRFDDFKGELDITFVRLSKTDAQISARGIFVRDEIEKLLRAKGFKKANKIYAVFYDGSSTQACGGGSWPPVLKGSVAALYLRGEIPGARPCGDNPFAPDEDSPGYWEFVLVHEVLHTLGFVATCAPSHVLSGHVGDDNEDLMYAGDQPWMPSLLDVNRDDYFDHSNGRCPDLLDSKFLLPAAANMEDSAWKLPLIQSFVTGPSPCGEGEPR
jgi:hypothetical protein